jgi:membrane protein DedA with SNARE-associated domain
MASVLGLIAATFVSEDAACIAAGLLMQRGQLDPLTAISACAIGIFLGDLGVWGLGRSGGWALRALPWLSQRVPDDQIGRLRAWLDRRPALAILGSRCLPGSRLPVYFAAGVAGMPVRRFALWTAFSVALWTPTLVLTSAMASDALTTQLPPVLAGRPSLTLAGTLALLTGGLWVTRRVTSAGSLQRLGRLASRLRRWEFWPASLFYLPVAVWIGLLIVRYHGVSAVRAANPGIPGGGVVGESKWEILRRLPATWTIPSSRIAEGSRAERLAEVRRVLTARGWSWPIVLKPDVGQRGAGVKRAWCPADIERYLDRTDEALLVQPYHPGPCEAGVFYARHPDEPRGRILAMTDKRFPVVTGDGQSTLTQLIERHPRYRLQAELFVRRHQSRAHLVLRKGETFALAVAGNHAQGTEFRDGWHLWSPALEARVDAIARQHPGFFIGRFDVRYRDAEQFRAGRDLAIVELNGVTGEPTNIYDPGCSIVQAYRGLFQQWSLVFRIGAANRRAGNPGSSGGLFGALRGHLWPRTVWDVSD